MNFEQIVKQLAQIIRDTDKKTPKAYDTQAVVTRIDEDGTAWVHIAGGVDETPVKRTIACSEGDSVQVRVSGGRAWITGNASAPPTDDATAIYARTIAREARASADNAQMVADAAGETATEAVRKAESAVTKANGSLASDTIHYLATDRSSGVTISTAGWTTSVQTISADKPYLWIYHTYTKANGSVVHTQPVIIGTLGKDGTSVTILGSYNTLAELQAAHPTGELGDSYMVAGDLYVWNGSAWENVGQIQGPQGPKGDTGATGPTGPTGPQGVSITKVEPQYYLSTSASSATGGSWSSTMTYSAGKYIWTREKITLSNGNTTYSTAVYNSALTSACANALSAHQIAEDTNQYFWHTESGTDTGTHVTEKTQEDFLADPTNGGGNLLMRSNGIAIRNGLTELTEVDGDGLTVNDGTGAPVAEFLNTGATVGKTSGIHLSLNSKGLDCYADSQHKPFSIDFSTASATGVETTLEAKHPSATDSCKAIFYANNDGSEFGINARDNANRTSQFYCMSERNGVPFVSASFNNLTDGSVGFVVLRPKPNDPTKSCFYVETDMFTVDWNGDIYPRNTKMTDFVIETGTDNSYTYTKWASGRLEAERVWNIGQVTLSTAETANTRVSSDITLPLPSLMTSGTIETSYAGNSSNSASYIERISSTSLRLAKNTTSNITLQNVTFTLRLINGRWK